MRNRDVVQNNSFDDCSARTGARLLRMPQYGIMDEEIARNLTKTYRMLSYVFASTIFIPSRVAEKPTGEESSSFLTRWKKSHFQQLCCF